jgi:hypothetical protein
MVYRSHICRKQDNIKIKPKISVSLVTLLKKVCEQSDRPIVGEGEEGHAQPTHILGQAINLKYGASALSLAYEKWHMLELQSIECDCFTNADVINCVPHIMSMK